jgi:hypothetical protein
MLEKMARAIASLGMVAKTYVPKAVLDVFLDYGAELDRLRAEVNELRSTIEKE